MQLLWLLCSLIVLLRVQADTNGPRSRNLLLFPSSACGSQPEMLAIGAQLLKRGHQLTALVPEGCAEDARKFIRSEKFMDHSPSVAAHGSRLNKLQAPPLSTSGTSSSSQSVSSSTETGSNSQGQGATESGSCAAAGGHEGGSGALESCGVSSVGSQDTGAPAAQAQEGKGVEGAQQQQPERQKQEQQEQQQQQQEEATRQAMLQSLKLIVYPGDMILEEFVSTKAMLRDESARVPLAQRTEFALANCGSLMTNTTIMTSLKAAGFDAVMGDLSDACAWPLADAINVDARIDVDVSGSPAPPYLAYNMRYPLAYVPAEGSGLAGGTLKLTEKVKNLYYHTKLAWEKRRVLLPKVEAFRRQYAELHPGLLRSQHTQQAQQNKQVQQIQQEQVTNINPTAGNKNLPLTLHQQRQQQQRQALEAELNAVKDVRLNTLLCLVTADWAFQEPYALPPLVKHVGPVLPGPAQPLPPVLKQFLEAKGKRSSLAKASGEQGDPPPPPAVVVGSFETGHYKLTRQALVGLAEAFTELTLLRVVWFLSESTQEQLATWYRPISTARHVHITSHLPLNDLLGHPNVQGYMCDGSLSSMYHALWHGVPMLTVAMSVEQESNVARALRLGVGRRLQRSHFQQGFGFMVEHALGRVCTGTAYRVRAAELSRRMRAANPKPAKAAAKAIESALEAGTSTFLHSMEVFLPWWKVAMLDVVLAFVAVILGTGIAIWGLVVATTKVAAWMHGNEQETAADHVETMKKFR